MSFHGIICFLFLSAGLCTSAQTSGVRWLEKDHDFGAFHEESGIVNTAFKFVNTSDEPVYILGARANCGCTTPSYPRDPVAPGDTAFVTVGFNPLGRVGKFSKYILVDTGSPENGSRERTKLTICGTVIGSSNTIAGRYPVEVGPLKLRSAAAAMGETVKGRIATASIAGYNRGEDSIVPRVTGLPDYMSATIRPEKVAPGEMVNILFSLDSHSCDEWGIITRTCKVECDTASTDVNTVAIIVEDFSRLTPEQLAQSPSIAIPRQIVIGDISRSGKTVEIKEKIYNRGKSPLTLRRVYTTDPGVEVYARSLTVAPGKSTDLVVKVDPSRLHPDTKVINSRIIVIANDPSSPQTTVRAVGTVTD